MTFSLRNWKAIATSLLGFTAACSLAACSSSSEPAETPDDSANATASAPAADSADIDTATPAGEEAQRIVNILNAEEDTTVEDWEDRLHSSFTDEVSAEELVELTNQNIRPAQPFTVTDYQGGDRQSVTTLASPVSEPLDMTVSVDTDGQIIGLFFGESDESS